MSAGALEDELDDQGDPLADRLGLTAAEHRQAAEQHLAEASDLRAQARPTWRQARLELTDGDGPPTARATRVRLGSEVMRWRDDRQRARDLVDAAHVHALLAGPAKR